MRYHLRTLGGLAAAGPDGEVLAGRRRELMILAVLARRGAGGIGRGELATLLWGERDEARARHSLRQALVELRRALGGETIVTAGDVVRLADGVVETDAARFLADAEAGRLEAAARRWEGDYLLAAEEVGGEGMRAWADRERAGLRAVAERVFARLAAEAEGAGAWAAMCEWCERWVAAAPLNDAAHLRLAQARLLAGRRDAAAAGRESWLREMESLGLRPSAGWAAVDEALRSPSPTSTSGRLTVPEPAMVGRAPAFAALVDAWASARSEGAAVVVEGEMGIGKTRLCDELLRWAAALDEPPFVLRSACSPEDRGDAWSSLRALLAGLRRAPGLGQAPDGALGDVALLAPALRERWPALPAGDGERLRDSFPQVLGAVAYEQPVVLLLDDAHDCDPDSRGLISRLARSLPPGVLLLLAGEREADASWADRIPRISLSPLDLGAVEEMVGSMLEMEDGERADLAERLHREIGGNPFLVRETVVALVSAGRLAPDAAGRWHLIASIDALPISRAAKERMTRGASRSAVGETREGDAAASAGDEAPPRRRWRRWIAAAAVVVGAVAIVPFATSDPAPASETSLAILPFAFRGSAEGEYLREGVPRLLEMGMEGAGGLRLVDLGGAGDSADVDAARERGARLVVQGSVVELDDRVRIEAEMVRVGWPRERVARVVEEGPADSVFAVADRVAARLLVSSVGASARPLRTAGGPAPSLPALRAYLVGEREFRARNLNSARDAFLQATALDSTFVPAWSRLAETGAWLLQPGLSRHAADQAWRHAGPLHPRERAMVAAYRDFVHGQADSAEARYRLLAEDHQTDRIHPEVWFQLAEVLFHHNWQRARPLGEARAPLERYLARTPDDWESTVHLIQLDAREGRVGEMDALLARQVALSAGDSLNTLRMRALAALVHRDSAATARVLAELDEAPTPMVVSTLWNVAVFGGDLDGSVRVAALLTDPERAPETRAFGHVALAYLETARGRPAAARAALARAEAEPKVRALHHAALLATHPDLPWPAAARDSLLRRLRAAPEVPESPVPAVWFSVHNGFGPQLDDYARGLLAASLGDGAAAERHAARLAAARGVRPVAAELARGLRAASEDDPARALTLLSAVDWQGPLEEARASPFHALARERFAYASALDRSGRAGDAERWYGSFADNSFHDLIYLAPSHLRRARLAERAGRRDVAISHYRAVVRLWARGEPAVQPYVREARARIAALGGGR